MNLTTAEAGERLRKSAYWVRRRLRDGDLRGTRAGGTWLIPEAAIDEYMTAHANAPKPTKAVARRRRRRN